MNSISEGTQLRDLHIPHLDTVIAECFGVIPSSLLGGGLDVKEWTVKALAERANMSADEVMKELRLIRELAENIEISVEDLAKLQDGNGNFGEHVYLLDVREPWEFEAAKIAGSILMDHHTLAAIVPRLQRSKHMICICHHGVRSYSAAMYLRQQGIAHAQSLAGGVDAWAKKIDPTIGVY